MGTQGRIGFLLGLALMLAACGDDGSGSADGGGDGGVPGADDYARYDVAWAADAVIVEDLSAIQAGLVAADYASGTFTFEEGTTGVSDLGVGDATLLAGIGAFRVDDVQMTGEGIELTLTPVPLTEVIEDGTIDFQRTLPDSDDAFLGLGIGEDEKDSIGLLRKGLGGSYEDGKLTFSGEVNNFMTDFSLQRVGEGLSVSMQTKYENGDALANAVVNGNIKRFRCVTHIDIAGGELKEFYVRFYDVAGDISVEAGASELTIADLKVEVPARMAIPIMVGPFPFRIEVGGSLEWESTLKTQTSALFEGKSTFNGHVGAGIIDGEFSPMATLNSASTTVVDVGNVGAVTAGLNVLMNFPEFRLGLGVPALADASAAFRFRTEVLTNLTVTYVSAGVTPIPDKFCSETGVNFGAEITQDVSIFGFALVNDATPVFGEIGPKKRSDGCE